MLRSLVGSEMCIRDSSPAGAGFYVKESCTMNDHDQVIIDSDMSFAQAIAVSYTHLTLPTIYSV